LFKLSLSDVGVLFRLSLLFVSIEVKTNVISPKTDPEQLKVVEKTFDLSG